MSHIRREESEERFGFDNEFPKTQIKEKIEMSEKESQDKLIVSEVKRDGCNIYFQIDNQPEQIVRGCGDVFGSSEEGRLIVSANEPMFISDERTGGPEILYVLGLDTSRDKELLKVPLSSERSFHRMIFECNEFLAHQAEENKLSRNRIGIDRRGNHKQIVDLTYDEVTDILRNYIEKQYGFRPRVMDIRWNADFVDSVCFTAQSFSDGLGDCVMKYGSRKFAPKSVMTKNVKPVTISKSGEGESK